MFYQYKTQVLNLEDHWIQIHKKSVCRLEVQDYTKLSFCIVITINNLIANWLDFLDILHWTAKGCNDFSGFNLIMLQYLHVFLCGKDILSHFSFCPTLTLLLKTSLWFCMFLLWKALHFHKIFCYNVFQHFLQNLHFKNYLIKILHVKCYVSYFLIIQYNHDACTDGTKF